jgi:hypothetical protein
MQIDVDEFSNHLSWTISHIGVSASIGGYFFLDTAF